MSFILLCRSDIKAKVEKLHIIEKLKKEKGLIIENIVTLPFAQWTGKVDEVFLITPDYDNEPIKIDFD